MNELDAAKKAAMLAGKITRKAFFGSFKIEKKESREFVTSADKEAERIVRRVLSENFPDYAIVGEELGEKEGKEAKWYIDPIDGTHNFMQHIPFFNTSIALEKDGEDRIGVVYNPILDEMFWAEKGKGAFMNKKRIRVGEPKEGALFAGTCYTSKNIDEAAKLISKFSKKYGSMKKYGSAELELCYVAAGFLDAFMGIDLKLWDFKAGVVVVREAGGIAEEVVFGKRRYLVASNIKMFPKLVELAK
ncbi:MAG: inositol monophosphatase family protein [Candidatus Anstonellales archaeon]